jgi:hypothetical protein
MVTLTVKKGRKHFGATLKHHLHNTIFIDCCKELCGRWNESEKAFVFRGLGADKVKELEELDILFNTEIVPYEIKWLRDDYRIRTSIPVLGYTIATATDHDSGADLGQGTTIIKGNVGSCGGVRKWSTVIKEGTIIKMMLPKKMVEAALEFGSYQHRRCREYHHHHHNQCNQLNDLLEFEEIKEPEPVVPKFAISKRAGNSLRNYIYKESIFEINAFFWRNRPINYIKNN